MAQSDLVLLNDRKSCVHNVEREMQEYEEVLSKRNAWRLQSSWPILRPRMLGLDTFPARSEATPHLTTRMWTCIMRRWGPSP